MKITEEDRRRSREYQKENFRVETKIEANSFLNQESIVVGVTHNGYQFSTIAFTREEAPAVLEAIKKALS